MLAALVQVGAASATSCDTSNNNTVRKLLGCVTLEGARAHQAALQEIADENGGTRASGTPGYDASLAYARGIFEGAGYTVTTQTFDYRVSIEVTPSVLQEVAPGTRDIPHVMMSYSGDGDVTAAVTHVVATGAGAGCNSADFAGFPTGNIALIQRGTCAFAVKATNALNAGASGAVIYNNIDGTLNGTLGATFAPEFPVVGVTLAEGQTLVSTSGLVLHLKTDTDRPTRTTANLFAESIYGNPDNVVMVGAHLDSVQAGPGINDNGSGTAAILEVAEAFRKVESTNRVRFALWGAEESGLVGSNLYMDTLTPAERDKIALYLNFDMIGSPNHVFFVYDGDNSDNVGAGPGPAGSAQIEDLFESYYSQTGNDWKGTDFTGRSDYGRFIFYGVPSGGLFTGAEGIKTVEEVGIWGGTAGAQYDPCYHAACDTFDNVNLQALDVNIDAVAYATLTYAYSTESVNGVVGTPVPGGTRVGRGNGRGHAGDAGSGGGLHDDHVLIES